MDAQILEPGSAAGATPAVSVGHSGGAEARLAAAAIDIFGERCRAAWLSGSFVYDGARPGRSDIDVVLLLDEPAPAGEAALARIRDFVDEYLAVHADSGLDPDLDFPGEYLAPATLEEAISWRGFALDGRIVERFPLVESADYWIDRPDRWFHAWVSMTAFSRFLAGRRDVHDAAKLAAWKTVLRFLLLRGGALAATPEALLPPLEQFGVKPRYRALWRLERDWVRRALAELEGDGAVSLEGDRAEPDAERQADWERRLAATIARHGDDPPPLLLDPELHREIERYATGRWAAMGGRVG